MSKRIFATVVAFMASAALLNLALGEAAVLFEMVGTGAQTRAELADDFGLGLIGLFVVAPASLIGALKAAALVWHHTGSKSQAQMPNKSFKADA